MTEAGENPGKGTYRCTNCGKTHTIKEDTDFLPTCKLCGEGEFEKV